MGAIILQGTHFLAPRSSMVTMPLTGTLEKSSANTTGAVKDTIKTTQQASSLILKNFMLDLSFFILQSADNADCTDYNECSVPSGAEDYFLSRPMRLGKKTSSGRALWRSRQRAVFYSPSQPLISSFLGTLPVHFTWLSTITDEVPKTP